jgi:hypothetical protein
VHLLLPLSDFFRMDFFFCSEGLETRLRREWPASNVSVDDIELRLPLPENGFSLVVRSRNH